jgi:hypothetical protein
MVEGGNHEDHGSPECFAKHRLRDSRWVEHRPVAQVCTGIAGCAEGQCCSRSGTRLPTGRNDDPVGTQPPGLLVAPWPARVPVGTLDLLVAPRPAYLRLAVMPRRIDWLASRIQNLRRKSSS